MFGDDHPNSLDRSTLDYWIKPRGSQQPRVLELSTTGAENLSVLDIEGKVLENGSINTEKISVKRMQERMVPTMGLIKEGGSNIVMHRDCIPYKPMVVTRGTGVGTEQERESRGDRLEEGTPARRAT